jgi:hypothetical protein
MDLGDAILKAIQDAVEGQRRRTGTVTGTSGTKVVVTVDSATMTIPRLSSYTPIVGDVVAIDTSGDGWLVLGKSA